MDPRVAPLYEIFKINSRLYMNCIDGMDSDQAGWRPNDRTNSAGFLALHLVESRYWMANMFGIESKNPLAGHSAGAKGIEDVKSMPSLEELRSAWKAVTGEMRERFKTITAAELDAPPKWQSPIEDKTTLGMLAFLMQHDSYHIGQMAILRKQVGLEAMAY